MAPPKQDADDALARIAATDTDVIAYWGSVQRPTDDRLIQLCAGRRLRRHCLLWLATRGGDANAAYRIARCLQRRYKTSAQDAAQKGSFTVFVDSTCKSAGTIIALGADKLLLSERAELGPIDVQLRKPEEVGERTSGLTPIQALGFLRDQSTRFFKEFFSNLRFDDELAFSTKAAAEIATNLTVGVMRPLFEQIDPIRLAEVNRAVNISAEYGERIGKTNLKTNGLTRLLAEYPSHSFVIDATEARDIFKNVDEPSADLRMVADYWEWYPDFMMDARDQAPAVWFLTAEPDAAPAAPGPDGGGG